MPWMDMLYRTYEANAGMAGKTDEKVPLSLVAHMIASAQIEVTIDEAGNFVRAVALDKADARTIIPVTESSASRANGIAPHALCDTLSYVAGDFPDFVSDSEIAERSIEKFKAYIAGLRTWCLSSYTLPKISAVFQYLLQVKLTQDLISAGILKSNEDGKLDEGKIDGRTYDKALVRFRVLGTLPDSVWEDPVLFASYTDFYLSQQAGKKDLCYLSGQESSISTNHPKGIIAANYGAKLISANDTSNFVFRGRFLTSEQACTIGYEATQKAHSALTWLAARQGVYIGSKDRRTYICWNPLGKDVVNVADSLGLEDDSPIHPFTEEEYKKRLIDTINGHRGKLDKTDDIVVIGLDAATTGRLSVTYYNELTASDFYDRLQKWGETCCWYFLQFTLEKKPYFEVLTPLTKSIVANAFGTERGNYIETDDKIMKEQTQRILHCILDDAPVPWDIVHALVNRASNPQAFTRGNHERILSTACALIKKYYTNKGGKIEMTLNYESRDRSYLFGRLLAVMEKAERSTYKEEDREPNAIRLQSAFVNHPLSTWKILETQLNPYFQRMKPGSRIFYKNLISEIAEKLAEQEPEQMNRGLSEMYLIGYYLQRANLNNKEASNENKEESL